MRHHGKTMMLDLDRVDLEAIAEALGDQSPYEHRWLLDPGTGEVVLWTADGGIDGETPIDLEDLDLVSIETLPPYVWYQDMADFAAGITNDDVRRRLGRAIDGHGAFRRFKNELAEEYPELLPAWYAFRDSRAQCRAIQWLADNVLVDEDVATRYFAAHPDPALP